MLNAKILRRSPTETCAPDAGDPEALVDAGPAGEGEGREVANERGACGREAGGRRAAAARDARTNAAAERGRRERGNARAGSAEDGVARRSAAGGSGGGDPRRERADPNEAAEARSRARDAARRHIADDAPTGVAVPARVAREAPASRAATFRCDERRRRRSSARR